MRFGGRPAVLVALLDTSEPSRALGAAEWNAGMLARTESLCRSGSFEIELPSGQLQPSEGLCALLGLDAAAAAAHPVDDLAWVPAAERAAVAAAWRGALPDEPFEFQHGVLAADGSRKVVRHRGVLPAGALGAGRRRGIAILQDITSLLETERRLEAVSNHNEVTGLPNRNRFLGQLERAVRAAAAARRSFALLSIDVARIAEVKSSMGFGAADALAMAIAARLAAERREGETLAQLGETEFALLLEPESGPEPEALRLRARRVQAALEAGVRLVETDLYPRCVVGIAGFPADGASATELLERAQTARQGAAAEGGVAFFDAASNRRTLRNMQLEAALRHALERDELHLVFQPQVDLARGAICGAEALLRWNSAELGPVSPAEFIPVAERAGLIGAIGEWVMRQACLQAAAWRRAGLPPLRVGVNLSPAQLQRPDLALEVHRVLIETGADPACLGLELTESMAMVDPEHAAAVLRAVKAVGVEISLDDFGTGYSSLSCLRSLPIDVVKVDRSFVHDVTAAAHDVSVTRSIITMAHGLQMRVLVEGVETEGQLALLAANRCDMVQGFWFSPPVPAAEFEQMLRADKRLPERFLTRSRRPRTLLLVDDESNILAALRRLLRRDGYHILTAGSAAEGLQRLAEGDVDVIVSDQRMPGLSGVEFLRRAKDLYPETVRIVLSGYTELQSIIDAVNEGAIYRFLTKPWDDERLRAHVAEAFHQKAMADENRRLARELESANGELASLNERLERVVARQREQADLLAHGAGSMRELLDELPAPVLGIDPDGTIAFSNGEAERLLAGGALGRPAAELLEGDDTAVRIAGQPWRLLARPYGEAHQARLVVLVPPGAEAAA
ncbi:MAG: EAL domain-containing protein [Rubrivivax sp.]